MQLVKLGYGDVRRNKEINYESGSTEVDTLGCFFDVHVFM